MQAFDKAVESVVSCATFAATYEQVFQIAWDSWSQGQLVRLACDEPGDVERIARAAWERVRQ